MREKKEGASSRDNKREGKREEMRGDEKCRVDRRAVWVHLSVDLSPLKWLPTGWGLSEQDNEHHTQGHIPLGLCHDVVMLYV